jgi:hypothetical protein
MTGRRAVALRSRRAGYTLMEMCAVAALLLIMAALALPAINCLMVDSRVDAAGDMIRARMADARSMAMEQNRPYRFGFVPGTGKFQIAPDDADSWNSVSDSGIVDKEDLLRGELPADVVFATDPSGLGDGTPSPGSSWELGGVFLPSGEARGPLNPDGTSVDDVTFYFGKPGLAPHGVRLHGLTGIVRVFDPSAEGGQP